MERNKDRWRTHNAKQYIETNINYGAFNIQCTKQEQQNNEIDTQQHNDLLIFGPAVLNDLRFS